MEWLRNIRFECVPTGLLCRFPFTHDEWLVWAEWYNKCPNMWNLALYNKATNTFLAFVYGQWDPLEREMRVLRVSIHPDFFSVEGRALGEIVTELKWFAKDLYVEKIYWETDKWKAFKRKLGDDVNLLNARVLEVA